ncbi:MAG: ParB/RepB/Spo0J family partition protein [Deltaproteobacteria bacterium]|nr:MAG: ParB/RepB/Spo0J family partition protein [Deltaproteobacteria bacterium]
MVRKPESNPRQRKKMALGKGLDALIPDIDSAEDRQREYIQCNINLIRPNRYQPRRRFPEAELAELCESIRTQGIIQPLLVRKHDSGYEIVAGERRFRAAKKAGLEEVPVIIKSVSDAKLLEISIVENIQREDLNPIEKAEAFHRLISEFNLTQDQAASRVGQSRSAVANFLRLRQLPDQIKESILNGTLSMGHARALLGIQTSAQQTAAWRAIVSKGLSVRETEKLVNRLKNKQKMEKKTTPSTEDIYFSGLADELSRYFGTKVQIHRRGNRGKLEIEFYNNEDLDRLIALFKGE